MSNRVSYILAVLLLLLAVALRMTSLATLPPGFSNNEINDLRITETVRQGRVEVFYDLNGQGREGLYQAFLAAATTAGGGLIGYRIFSVWIGMITLALVYVLGKRLFGALAGLASMALLSVSMFPILLSRSVAPESMLPLFVTAVLVALALSLPVAQKVAQPNTAAFGALGVLLGLGFYLHPESILVALFSVLFIAFVILVRRPAPRHMISFTWFALVVMVVIATPYVISSLQRPELAAAGRLLVDDPNNGFLQSLGAGFNGLFLLGDSNPLVNLPGRPLIDLVSGVLMIIGVVVTLRWWRQSRYALLLIALVFIAPTALHAPNSPNFLAFAPLLPLIALFFGVGVTTLYQSLPHNTRLIAALGLVALFAFNIVWVTRDFFANWPSQPNMQTAYNARLGELAHYIDLTSGDTPTVICTSTLTPPTNPITLTNTQLLALMMHRQNAVLRYADCGTALILTDGGSNEQVILLDFSGISSVNPVVQGWLNQGTVLNSPNLPPQSVIRLQVADALAKHIGSFMTTAPIMFDAPASGGTQITAPPLSFGGNLTFLGYEHSWASTYAPGAVVPVTTYWRVDGPLPTDLRMFTHILSDPTTIAAQSDPISVLPEQLLPRDIFIQVTYVMLPRSMPLGTYSISIGAYRDTVPQMRLPVLLNGQPHGARLFVGQITVQDK